MASLNGEPRKCPPTERNEIENELIRQAEKLQSRPSGIRPDVGGILPDGSLYDPYAFLHEIHLGVRYGHNPFLADLRQLPWTDPGHTIPNPEYVRPSPHSMTNYQCWREITDAQICEVFYYGKNPHLPNPKVIDGLVFSRKDYF